MASIQLTQVILLQTTPQTNPPTVYVVENSESLLAINPVLLNLKSQNKPPNHWFLYPTSQEPKF